MFKKITFTLLAFTSAMFANASDVSGYGRHEYHEDPEIAQIQRDVDRLAEASFLSAMTIPDKIETNWEPFEKKLQSEINRRMDINNEKLK